MRSLADVLVGCGWQLSGSDRDIEPALFLESRGVRLYRGHAADCLSPDAELVIASSAVPSENAEIRRAVELGIPVLSYAQMLGRIMAGRRGLAIAGTHGKSTATAMAAELLIAAGKDPTVIHGAVPLEGASGGRAGHGDLVLVEACEYRANFLHLAPEQAVILGIEPDHFDCYANLSELLDAFAQFAQKVPRHGLLLVRSDCDATRRAISAATARVETFGLEPEADWSATDLAQQEGNYAFRVDFRGKPFCETRLQIPGQHNVLNALAAAALAAHNGLSAAKISHGLTRFRGLRRRLEPLGDFGGITLLDDYAHHPTEITAGLATARQMYPGRRLWCLFQPHQASRTARLLDEMAVSLQNADKVVIAEIFRAREPPPRSGEVTAADLARKLRAGGVDVADVYRAEPIVRLLKSQLRPGDVLMTMGAGDVRKFCNEFIRRF